MGGCAVSGRVGLSGSGLIWKLCDDSLGLARDMVDDEKADERLAKAMFKVWRI